MLRETGTFRNTTMTRTDKAGQDSCFVQKLQRTANDKHCQGITCKTLVSTGFSLIYFRTVGLFRSDTLCF